MKPTLTMTILGASARAAAASAQRAGFTPCAVDLFADVDTQAIARTIRIADYPSGFLHAARDLPDAPWMYTGGLENYPELIDALAELRPLWGNAGDVLRAVRDPLEWTTVLRDAQIPTPDVTRDIRQVTRDGLWLAKPLRSAGGLGIRVVDNTTDLAATASGDFYFQERLPGTAASAVFVAARRKARLLGATRQLCGTPWAEARPFWYAGSIGPWHLPAPAALALRQLGDVLAEAFDLTGLFGVDGVVNDDGFWPVEINPRYTASVEILERATGENFLQFHADACQRGSLPTALPANESSGWGKAILYAERAAIFGPAAAEWVAEANRHGAWPAVADIPHRGEHFMKGDPVATVFAERTSATAVDDELRTRCAELRARLD